MSRRIRSIKPEILDDDKTASLSHVAWRLFVSGLTLSDDHGNLRAGVTFLQGQVFHSCPDTDPEVVRAAVVELAAVDLWQVYNVRGQTYAHIRGWSKHQRIDNAGKPKVPGPSEADGTDPISAEAKNKVRRESPRVAASRRESPRVAASRRESPLEGDQDQEGDGKGKGNPPLPPPGGMREGAHVHACEEVPPTSPAAHVLATVASTEPPPSRTPPAPVEVAPPAPAPSAPPSHATGPSSAPDAEEDDEPPPAQRVPSTPRPEPVPVQAPAPVAPPAAAPTLPLDLPPAPTPAPAPAPAKRRGKAAPEAVEADVLAVFECWRETVWKGRAVLNAARRARIASRLAEGFSVDDLKDAARGALKDDWLMGRKEGARPGGYRDIETVFRDAAQVERLMRLAPRPVPPPAQFPPIVPRALPPGVGVTPTCLPHEWLTKGATLAPRPRRVTAAEIDAALAAMPPRPETTHA